MQRMGTYIYQKPQWPYFTWKNDDLILLLSEVKYMQGKLLGSMQNLGFDMISEALIEIISIDVLKSSEIEGELLDKAQVRSSLTRRLGIEVAGLIDSDRHVEGVVEMMVDATQNYLTPLSKERLFDWHSAMFSTGRSGMSKIIVGDWRKDTTGPMQVVSGSIGKEKVHFQAPPFNTLNKEMKKFINWVNDDTTNTDGLIKAAIGHLWFITIHPFEDGNGRIARAITDMLLARSDNSNLRFYSMSAQIRLERKVYYDILEKTQKGGLDITAWLIWFLKCLRNALVSSEYVLKKILQKANFWKTHSSILLNERQHILINKLLDGIDGKLTSSKWAKITKSSKDTAIRDINDLIDKKMLRKEAAGGRSTSYELCMHTKHGFD